MEKEVKSLQDVTVRFAGDSGDGMQLTGQQFSDATAAAGNDLLTLPDYPAEIRAPAGTLYGVSGFQLHFSSYDIHTPGDRPDVLVAMNPAALKVNLRDLKPNAIIVVNNDAFDEKSLRLANYENNPLEDGSLSGYNVYPVPITSLTLKALEGLSLSNKEALKCKNFFALGLMYWIFSRPMEPTLEWIKSKFKNKPVIAEANERALKAGYYFGEQTELFTTRYVIEKAKLEPGVYRNINGNEAVALGLLSASVKSGLKLFLGTYPITPASEILHYLSYYKEFGVITFQAEDEIGGIVSAIGASYAGALAATTTSGPGLSLKTEAIGLAVITELPLVIVDVQRGGPSTGLPTKTEQGDLLQAIYGRHGESPVCVIAASSPADCFYMAYEACRIAIKYMTPVILLTDGYLANGSEPLKLVEPEDLPEIKVEFRKDPKDFYPYSRNEFFARPWAIPGTPGLEHRIGGLEKSHITGNVSYDPDNHDLMVRLRQQKIDKIADEIPPVKVEGEQNGDILVLTWGSMYGITKEAIYKVREQGFKVSHAHLKYLNPFPKNLGSVLKNFKNILIPEVNLGQLAKLIKMNYLIDVEQFNKVRGLPLKTYEIENKIKEILGGI
jgi:2-oxoglutarate ferredoxin oxidoreductase subunit alpha